MSTAYDFHMTTDAAGEAADAHSEAVAARAAELAQDDAEVLSALGSLDPDDYDALDALMVTAFRSGDWSAYTARMQAFLAAQLRQTAETALQAQRFSSAARAADSFADMLAARRAGAQ